MLLPGPFPWPQLVVSVYGLDAFGRGSKGHYSFECCPLAYSPAHMQVSVYGLDSFGRDVIKGYGCTHLPTCR